MDDSDSYSPENGMSAIVLANQWAFRLYQKLTCPLEIQPSPEELEANKNDFGHLYITYKN